ncbi:MAG: ATP synthase F1 subunit gamma [Dehalococcoidia bacterium]|nr:ATP synthase F1 subunit gamma [Dehalococcoidia bacterium]
MANIRAIRQRIRSITSAAKVTKAMELVAASKMRRAQERAFAGRPYAEDLRSVLSHLAAMAGEGGGDSAAHPLLARREPVRSAMIIEITPNRGLCGGLNSNLNRRAASFALEMREAGASIQVLSVGRKGRDFFSRSGTPIIAEFIELGDYPVMSDTLAIARVAIDEFLSGAVDRVDLVFPRFVNTVIQRPEVAQLLPIVPPAQAEGAAAKYADYIFEPSPEAVLTRLLPRYVETEVYAAVLEMAASEQSARMVAMRSASDAAKDMIQDLTLTYNKARQDQITRELLDLVGGAEALSGK